MERATGLEPTTTCLEGRSSSQLSYTRTTKMEALYKKYEFCQNFSSNDDIFRQQADWSRGRVVQSLQDLQEHGGVSTLREKEIHSLWFSSREDQGHKNLR